MMETGGGARGREGGGGCREMRALSTVRVNLIQRFGERSTDSDFAKLIFIFPAFFDGESLF